MTARANRARRHRIEIRARRRGRLRFREAKRRLRADPQLRGLSLWESLAYVECHCRGWPWPLPEGDPRRARVCGGMLVRTPA